MNLMGFFQLFPASKYKKFSSEIKYSDVWVIKNTYVKILYREANSWVNKNNNKMKDKTVYAEYPVKKTDNKYYWSSKPQENRKVVRYQPD